MNQRIRAFVECKEQWHMLKRRAIMQSKAFSNGTNSIMITDDHRSHNGPPPVTAPTSALPNALQLPGPGILQSLGLEYPNGQMGGSKMFKQFFSTTDVSGLQNNSNTSFPVDTAKLPGFSNSDVSVEITDFNFPGRIDFIIDHSLGEEWGELNRGRFSSSDGGCVSDQTYNSSAGSFSSANQFADFSRALQRRARNRKNQRASRMCYTNNTTVNIGSNIAHRRT
jgi:hypothetical protein